MKFVQTTLLILAAIIPSTFAAEIPVSGNSWIVNPSDGNTDTISHRGTFRWESPDSIVRTYFKAAEPGKLKIAVRAKADQGPSRIRFSWGSNSKEISIINNEFKIIPVGTLKTETPGYCFLEMQGTENSGGSFADITDIIIDGSGADSLLFVKDDFYWGRRGPSTHLKYQTPPDCGDILYFYNEITVPQGSDIPGSYYMANGFNGGYFGIQVNSETERRILFSVWSPFKTNNPKEVPEEQRIKLLRKGADVHAGKFGGEGSGGQSYRKYFWKAGTTYRFLLKGEPSTDGCSDFTAWFFAPEIGKWELMASFRRPITTTFLKHPHSFLENFQTETGYLPRTAYYSNQWIRNTEGQWHEITGFTFSADATARKQNRLDFTGGSDKKRFFLKNCGFFDADVEIGTPFSRRPTGTPPDINFDSLP